MATFRKESFYVMCRLDNGNIGAVKQNGFTDGEFNYYQSKDGWHCIDKDTGLSLLRGAVSSRKLAYDEGRSNKEKLASYMQTKDYQNKVLEFYNAKVKCGAYVFLHDVEGQK